MVMKMANKKKQKKYYLFEYDMGFLSFLSIIILILLILAIGFFDKWTIFKSILVASDQKTGDFEFIFLVILMFLWVFLHELFHGIMYLVNGAKKENLSFGVALEKGILYCLCKEYISKKNILISAISPFLLIGVLTSILGMIFNNSYLVILSIMNMSSSIADIILVLFLLKLPKNIEFCEYDNSTGFIIKSDENISKISAIGLKFVRVLDEDKELSFDKYKTLYMSKVSKYIAIVFIIIFILVILKRI